MAVEEYVDQLCSNHTKEQKCGDEAAEPIETVGRTVTIKIAKEFDDFLQILTKANDMTIEKFLSERVYAMLYNFYDGDYWGPLLEPLGKRLDKLALRVWQEL